MSNPNELLNEMLVEIFERLPTKSVGKCRCLSKTWNTNLSTKHFIDSHLTRTKTRQEKEKEKLVIVIRWGRRNNLHIVNLPSENVEIPEGLDFGVGLATVVGSSNGLVMLLKCQSEQIKMYVANPITRQQVKIPNPSPIYYMNDPTLIYGFGYDPSSDDYKVVTIYYMIGAIDNRSCVDVYSSKLRTWIRVDELEYKPADFIMPFVSGAVHWLTRDDDNWQTRNENTKYHIEALDLATETFHQVPLPDAFTTEKGYQSLVVVNDCLGVIFSSTNENARVWVMKEYGEVNSWVKFSFNVNTMGEEMKLVCSLDKLDSLYISTDGMDCLLSCESGVIHWGFNKASWSVFVESLVSPNQENVVAR